MVIAPIYIVPTGLDLSEYDRKNLDENRVQSIREELGFTSEDRIVVFVGRIAKEKAIEIPIEAISKNADPHLHLVIVGGGTDMEYYQDLAKKYNVSDRVHFTGKIPKENIAYYYAAFDCFVSASLSETQGMTYIEALASGLLVFGRRDEVLKDLVDEGKSGYYFDDANELSQKWDVFFSKSKEERDALRAYCISKTAPYTESMFAHKALSVYNQAIDDYKRAYHVERIRMVDDFVRLTVMRDCDNEPVKVMIPTDDFFDLKITKDTMYQMVQYGKKYLGLDEDQALDIVHEFMERHWIDDKEYAFDKAQAWHSYGQPKMQICQKLKRAGIADDVIEDALASLDVETERSNAIKLARRLAHSLKEQSSRMQRQTLVNKLVTKGYSFELAKQVSESIELDENDDEALQRTIAKAKRLYATFDQPKRNQKIQTYCVRKGFNISAIKEVLEGESE